ncbi:MAG: DUF2232 domain-containing protein [bacterium]
MSARWAVCPFVAGVVTIGATFVLANSDGSVMEGSLLMSLVPLSVTVAWGLSLFLSRTVGLHLVLAAALLFAVAILTSEGVALALVAYVACGLGLGLALTCGWRHDVTLGLGLLPMLVVTFWAAAQLPYDQLILESEQEAAVWLESQLHTIEDEQARAMLLADNLRVLAWMTKVIQQTWPGLLVLGLLANVSLALLLIRWLGRLLRSSLPIRSFGSFHQWRFPFYLVWCLAVGLVLIISRADGWSRAGLNIVLVTGLVIGIQGLAVQINLMGRIWPAWARILFWTIGALFLPPVIFASSILLGLVDQWLDLRRLSPVPDR